MQRDIISVLSGLNRFFMTIDVERPQSTAPPPVSTASIQHHHPAYFQEIDGIRAIAVLLVMFCHAKLLGLGGGYIGVDVFFVISGYVVTLAILRQQQAGKFALMDFYARRLRRLLPSLYTVALATLVFCLLFTFPENNLELLKNLGFMMVFGSNIYLARQTGYFDVESAKQPLLHTWSLSVEEQFYFILPLCLVLVHRYRPQARVLAVFAALALALAYSILHTDKVGAAGYYFLPARLFEFLIGVAIAVVIARLNFLRGYMADALVVAGIVLLWLCSVNYGPQTIMPGKNAILPCFAAGLLIIGGRYAGMLQPLLSNRPLGYLGRISYPLYLWHWPMIFGFNRFGLGSTGWMCLALAISLVLAMLTHHLIETPWRARKDRPGRTWLMLWVAPFAFLLALFGLARSTDNFSAFYPQQYRADYQNAGLSVFDSPRAKKNCWSKVDVTSPQDCRLGADGVPVTAVLWGDSHAYHQISFIDAIGKAQGIAIHDLAFTMCGPIATSPERAGVPGYQRHAEECRTHGIAVMKYILDHPDIQWVFMSAAWHIYHVPDDYPGVNVHGFAPRQFDAELTATLKQLEAAGKRVVFLDDIPYLPPDMVNCPSNRVFLPGFPQRECSFSRTVAEQNYPVMAGVVRRMAQAFPATAVIDTYYVPCDETHCHAERDGVALYRHDDSSHLGLGGSNIFYQLYLKKYPDQLNAIFQRK